MKISFSYIPLALEKRNIDLPSADILIISPCAYMKIKYYIYTSY